MTQQTDPADFRIVQAVQEFSRAGGTETVAFELQRAWEADGTPSSVLAAVIGPDIPAAARMRVRFALPTLLQHIPTRGRWRHIGRSMLVPAYTVAASIMLRRDQRGSGGTDKPVVLSHGDSLVADVVVLHAVNAANLAQKRLDREWRWMFNPLHFWVGARDRLMLRGLRARRYVAVSNRVVSELERFHGIPRDRISVIPNGTDIARFSPDGPVAGLREACGIGVGDTMLLFVGHEFDRKGLKYAIAALCHPGCAQAHLVAVGAGDIARYTAMANAMGVGKRVHFAGPRNDLPAIYREADAFVFPTAYETFSLVCMEAMACGVPIFATRVGGIEDYLEDGVNGHAIERDGAMIAAVLGPALADPVARAQLRDGARRTALGYGWDVVARRYRALLLQVWLEKRACHEG